jgi:hypothetical protein
MEVACSTDPKNHGWDLLSWHIVYRWALVAMEAFVFASFPFKAPDGAPLQRGPDGSPTEYGVYLLDESTAPSAGLVTVAAKDEWAMAFADASIPVLHSPNPKGDPKNGCLMAALLISPLGNRSFPPPPWKL